MAWNSSFQNKSAMQPAPKQMVGPGAPVAQNVAYAGRAYKDAWDIERVYREGMQRVTWVSRCVDAIAGNQARLPVILRADNSPHGEILVGRKALNSSILPLLNTKSNIGENSYIFRYRVSSQLLMSSRGVFIEKLRGRDGSIVGLSLLPPQSTAPIPDPKTFVSGYEVQMPNGMKIIMKPDDVVWIRRPHPLDPYLSMTPLEAAGVAVEIEHLAKLYNRNYLMNDGRPGGMLVLRGEIDDEDKEEIRNRFRGNIARAGYTTVISSDDGADYIDTSASPRDAAYIQMRQITKEEILAAFGVPESVIGNASGRTFSNADAEIRVFWNETMLPHVEQIARALDELDEENYVDFDTRSVPVLILYEQERNRYLMEEFQNGLISNNEYRIATGKKDTESDLADSLLMNPNLTPISNTKKKMDQGQQAQVNGGAPGVPGAPGMPPVAPGQEGTAPPDPTTMAGAMALAAQSGVTAPPQTDVAPPSAPENSAAPMPEGQLSAPTGMIQTKADSEWDDKVSQSINRWEQILDRSLERVFERQQRVVLEKANGVKAKKQLATGTLDIESIFSRDTWAKQMEEDIRPVLAAILSDSRDTYSEKSLLTTPFTKEDAIVHLNAQLSRIKQINNETFDEIGESMLTVLNISNEDARHTTFRSSIVSVFTNLLAKKRPEIARSETRRAWVAGV
jgi:HK97 family phage portal protein